MTSSLGCRISLVILSLSAVAPAFSEDLATTIKTHVRQQIDREQSKLIVTVNATAKQVARAKLCHRLEAFTPPGAQLAGRIYIGARCLDASAWRMWIAVRIQRFRPYAVTVRALAAGEKITDVDLSIVEGDLAVLPADAVLETTQLLGMELTQAVPAGSLIRFRQVRRPFVIHRGESVSVSIRDKGYQVSSRGVAINDGGLGEKITVKMVSGATLTGRGIGIGHVQVE